ncbi:MAG: ComF family protein [Desulfobacteraceae bacterium]|nr:ComF family protein [Desulfobacteraceae bacterium]
MFKIFQDHCRKDSFSGMKKIFSFFEGLLYPPKCIRCGRYLQNTRQGRTNALSSCFCHDCMTMGYTEFQAPFCPKCGRMYNNPAEENHYCGECLKTPGRINSVRAAASYEGIIKQGIHLLKYKGALSCSPLFEAMIFSAYTQYFSSQKIDVVIPMPLHKRKARQRGFNQAVIIARNLKKLYETHFLKAPDFCFNSNCLYRVKNTKSQTGFDAETRKKNVENAFQVREAKIIKDKNVLLLDDVYTTGATCNEAAVTLLNAGAGQVDVLVLARA